MGGLSAVGILQYHGNTAVNERGPATAPERRFDLTLRSSPATVAGTDMEQTFYFYRNPA
jgi:hypothetical protein